MSDPVTNAEVEDVLSSIRRLVSEDKRPIQTQNAEPANDRLVLTPALRVSNDAEQGAENGNDPDIADETPAKPTLTLESLVTDDTPLDVYGDGDTERSLSDAFEDEEEGHLFNDPAHDYSDDPYNFDDDEDKDGGEDPAQDASADLNEESVNEDEANSALSQTAVLSPADQVDVEDAPQPSLTTADSKAATLTAKIAALETAIGQISETWEPDDAGDSDYAGTEPESMAWEDDTVDAEAEEHDEAAATFNPPEALKELEPAVERETQPVETKAESQPTEPEAQPVSAAPVIAVATPNIEPDLDNLEEEQLLDEDALRDMISDIVRAELQGALGERITRNVRKLVRREIHRALTAQELD